MRSRRNRLSSKDRRRKKKNRLAYIIFGVVGVVVAGFVALSVSIKSEHIALERESMCPVDGPSAYTVILIDATDEFTAIQKADLRRYFNQLRGAVPKYSQVAIYAPQEMSQENLLSPELKICNPGDAEGISGITGNPDQIQRRYEKSFAQKVDAVLNRGLHSGGADSSPVMEMIQAVAVDGFPIRSDLPKRLIIVSDMLQNTPWYSQYRDPIDFESVKVNPRFQHVYVDLSGVDIDILYVGRKGYESLQTNGHGLFWEAYFKYMNGNLISISRIGG